MGAGADAKLLFAHRCLHVGGGKKWVVLLQAMSWCWDLTSPPGPRGWGLGGTGSKDNYLYSVLTNDWLWMGGFLQPLLHPGFARLRLTRGGFFVWLCLIPVAPGGLRVVGGDCVSEDVGSRTKFGHGILQILGLATSPFRKKIVGKNGDKYPPVQRGDSDSGNGSPFSQPAGHNLVRPNLKVVFPLFLQFYPPSGTSKKPLLCSHSIIVVAGEPSRSSEQNQLNLGLGSHYFLTYLSSLNIMLWFLSLKCISSAKKPKAQPVLVQRSPARGGNACKLSAAPTSQQRYFANIDLPPQPIKDIQGKGLFCFNKLFCRWYRDTV